MKFNKNTNKDNVSKLFDDVMEIIKSTNIENSNANVDERSFGGRKFRASGELHKYIALNKVMTTKFKLAHENNKFYIHDLDSYDIGQHNCTLIDLEDILLRGFKVRNGDIRSPQSVLTAYQLVAVVFQIQSQVQYGGVGSAAFDTEMIPFVKRSFIKHFNDELKIYNRRKPKLLQVSFNDDVKTVTKTEIKMNPVKRAIYNLIHGYAMDNLKKELAQASEGLIHNLNSLESRPGSQLPFTSVNIGYDTREEARLVSEYLLKALLEGIGENHKTSIFPIIIFKYKKGVNAKKTDPNYDIKQLAIKCLSKRIYPNFVNCDSPYFKNDGTPKGTMATMG